LAWQVHVPKQDHNAPRQSESLMAEFKANRNDESHDDLIVTIDDGRFQNLACDEVILDWLMNLEAEDSAADLDDARREPASRYVHC
jgi:hypothetical protein